MAGEAGLGLGVFELGVAEDLATQRGEAGIVVEQLGAGVDVVVVVIGIAVVVEPALHALGEVFVMVHAGVFALPKARLHRGVVAGLHALIEGGIDIDNAAQVNVVRQLVDEDVFRAVGIAIVSEEVFLRAGAVGIRDATAHAAGPCIAEITGAEILKTFLFLLGEPDPLGLIAGELVVREDAQSCAAFHHGLANVRTLREHHIDDVNGLLQRIRTHLGRGDDGKAACAGLLRVKRRQSTHAKGLHTHLSSHEALFFVLATHHGKAMPERGADDRVLARRHGAIRDAFAFFIDPKHIHDLRGAIDDLELRAVQRGVKVRPHEEHGGKEKGDQASRHGQRPV